jgi:hypothetical protein
MNGWWWDPVGRLGRRRRSLFRRVVTRLLFGSRRQRIRRGWY